MIDSKLIEFDKVSTTKEIVFDKLSALVVENGYATNITSVKQALLDREKEGTTGMMDGFAIPHAKSTAITKAGVAILRLSNGVEWQSMDGQRITSVIALFIPDGERGKTHLRYLSQIARLLMQEKFKKEFKSANTPEEIQMVLTTYLEE